MIFSYTENATIFFTSLFSQRNYEEHVIVKVTKQQLIQHAKEQRAQNK